MSSEDTKPSQESKKQQQQHKQPKQEDDIENVDIESINPVTPTTTSESQQVLEQHDPDDVISAEILTQEGEKEFNPDSYGGFNLDHWKRFYGSIQDERQARRAKLSALSKYNIRINTSNDIFNPRWVVKTYQYYKVTTQAWNMRQKLTAEADDMQRTADAELIKLQEIQTAIQERRTASISGQRTGNNRGGSRSIESFDSNELQNEQFYNEMDKKIRQSITEKKVEAEWTAARMYLHMSREDFENCLYEPDLADVIGACDHKQIWGIPKNPTPLVKSPLQERQAIS